MKLLYLGNEVQWTPKCPNNLNEEERFLNWSLPVGRRMERGERPVRVYFSDDIVGKQKEQTSNFK